VACSFTVVATLGYHVGAIAEGFMERAFFELVDDFENVVSDRIGSPALREIAEKFGLTNVSYLAINIPRIKDPAYIVTTYSTNWVHRYVSQDYVSIDPVIQVGLRGILPLDWRDVRDANPSAKSFFGESREFGLGNQGLSFPIRGLNGETAMFSLNAERSDREWTLDKKKLMREFQILANLFHCRVLEELGVQLEQVQLSAKETECLKWVADGKTNFEIGVILNISERTVRFFLESARSKLGTVNSTQAVARALRLHILK
jgi:DNA-binding CsgD family transcriptional regulator